MGINGSTILVFKRWWRDWMKKHDEQEEWFVSNERPEVSHIDHIFTILEFSSPEIAIFFKLRWE